MDKYNVMLVLRWSTTNRYSR